MSNMVMGTNGLNLLKSYEKCPKDSKGNVVAYWDSLGGVWTIGWGDTKNCYKGKVETQLQADNNLKRDMIAYGTTVNNSIKKPINQNQFDAMVDLCYNIGQDQKKGFPSSSLVRDFNNGNLKACPDDFRKWNMAGGKPVQGLTNRRNKEVALFNTAVKTGNATPSANNNNTNAQKDAQKKLDQKKANDKIIADKKAIEDKKKADLKAEEVLKQAKLTKDADAIKKAQAQLDAQKKTTPKSTPAKNTTQPSTPSSANKVVKSGFSLIGILAIIILMKGYTEGTETL